jgi:hypothetical protein
MTFKWGTTKDENAELASENCLSHYTTDTTQMLYSVQPDILPSVKWLCKQQNNLVVYT